MTAHKEKNPSEQLSVLCRHCKKKKECIRKSRLQRLLMQSTTYCTRFENTDDKPSLFPVLQPYQQQIQNAMKNVKNYPL